MTAIQQFERIHAEDIAMRDAGIEPTREQYKAYIAARCAAAAQLVTESGLRTMYDRACTAVAAKKKYSKLARNLIACLIEDITMLYPVTDLTTPEGGLWWADLRDPLTMTIVLDRAHCALECIDRDV